MAAKTRKGYLSLFPAHWEVYRMDEILDRLKNKVEVKKEESYKQIGIRSHGKGIFYKEEVTGEELGNKSVFWIEPDCFIVNIVFAWEMAVAKTTTADVGLIASHRFPMYKPKSDLLDLDFLLYYFKMPLGKYLFGLASPGGAGRNKTLGQKEFAELEICIPPVNEQKDIVSIISIWDKAISLKEKLIEEKKLLKKGLMQLLFTGKLISEDFDISNEKVKLGCLCKITTGKLDANAMKPNGKYRFYTCAKEYYRIDVFAFDSEALLVSGNGANVGYIHYYDGKFNAYQRTYVLTDFSLDILYVKYYLDSYLKERISKEKLDGNTPYIKIDTLSEMEISVPNLKTQKEITKILLNVDDDILLLEKELKETVLQKKGLMQQLLSGKTKAL